MNEFIQAYVDNLPSPAREFAAKVAAGEPPVICTLAISEAEAIAAAIAELRQFDAMDNRATVKESLTVEMVCAWCYPNDHRPGITHGLCSGHKAALLAQLEAGK